MKKTFAKIISLFAALSLVACISFAEVKVDDVGSFFFFTLGDEIIETH